jgi:methyl-accepting chemotaxis protein
MSFDDLKLRTKTLIPLVGMAVIFTAVIGVGTAKLVELTRRYGQIASGVEPAMLQTARAARSANEVVREAYGLLSYDPQGSWAKQVTADFQRAKAKGDQQFDEASRLNPAGADRYRAFKERFDAIYEAAKAPVAIGDAIPPLNIGRKLKPAELDQMATGLTELEAIDKDVTALATDVQGYNAALEADNAKAVETLKRDSANTIAMMIGLGLLSIVGGLVASIWTANAKVAAPLVRLGERMRRLAQGDLTVEIEGQARADEVGAMAKAVQVFKDNALKAKAMEAEAESLRAATEGQRAAAERERAARAAELARVVDTLADGLQKLSDGMLTHRVNEAFASEYERLRRDYNSAMEKIQAALSAVVSSSQGINSGAGEITQAADDLSRRTEQQAASLEETAAALDQITATVRKTAEGALQARDMVGRARNDAMASGDIVEGAIRAMGAIERSSSEISQIIGVIDEIAFQTNLLALNAGVEAARAGEAGRGFAVVASEVRALAQRSAEAAKEIKTLISASAKEVDQGVELVGQAGEALHRIVEQVAEIDAIVEEITHSSQEQATGLAQVNTAVNQMDQVVQQNAAMVEQSTAASHGLAQEADTLAELTRGFQVGGAEVRSARAPANVKPPPAARGRVAGFARSNQATAVKLESWEEF